MTFDEFINWKPESRQFELHHGTPIHTLLASWRRLVEDNLFTQSQ